MNQGLPAGLVRYGMFGLPIASRQMIDAVGTFNYTWQEGELLAMERIDLDQLYEESLEQPTLEDLTALERAAGDFKFYNYLELPLFWLPATVLLNQGTVADYVFPGTISGQISHLEYVEAVR